MHTSDLDPNLVAPSPRTASAVAGFSVDVFDSDGRRVALPRPEVQIVVRFGPSARNNLDVHVLGTQAAARRKHILRGQRAITARLQLGAPQAVLGVPASAVAGSIVALGDLWGHGAVQRLLDRLAGTTDGVAAVDIFDRALAERLALAATRDGGMSLARRAAAKLDTGTVSAVAADLGVSERQLRRVFHDAVGIGPKAFARLSRFRHALRVAREDGRHGWAHIAAAAGYYDQSHLIEEFRAIGGAAPRALLGELGILGEA